ncbi:hypothetical protein [Herbaspirillum chlorophenolicum]|uniref:hypothetical protein n=1 Tax=Herbaspirillum chlorophenolicum TaxID=211589 RepID=UPI0012E2DC82|nr:hypothetical protein [Herbaspirillum chlorophenolicum]
MLDFRKLDSEKHGSEYSIAGAPCCAAPAAHAEKTPIPDARQQKTASGDAVSRTAWVAQYAPGGGP